MAQLQDYSKPKALTCYICGRDFGTKSLSIHLKTCVRKWELQEISKPKKERRVLPQAPDLLIKVIDQEEIDYKDMINYNEQAAKRYNEEGLVKCEFCGRSFFEERVEGHKKICSKENPFKPLKKNELEENIREIRSKSVSKAEKRRKYTNGDISPVFYKEKTGELITIKKIEQIENLSNKEMKILKSYVIYTQKKTLNFNY